MSSLLPTDPEDRSRSPFQGTESYLLPPAAAGAAFLPTFYGFQCKTRLQLGRLPTLLPVTRERIVDGGKSSLFVAVAVGAQIAAQRSLEAVMPSDGTEEDTSMTKIAASSAGVGLLSSYPLAVANKLTAGEGLVSSLKGNSPCVLAWIAAREAAFVGSLRVSKPVQKAMQEKFGEGKGLECVSAFGTGVLGSLAGHVPDTVATCLQNGKPLAVDLRSLSRGGATRAVAAGTFSLLYNQFKDVLSSSQHNQGET